MVGGGRPLSCHLADKNTVLGVFSGAGCFIWPHNFFVLNAEGTVNSRNYRRPPAFWRFDHRRKNFFVIHDVKNVHQSESRLI